MQSRLRFAAQANESCGTRDDLEVFSKKRDGGSKNRVPGANSLAESGRLAAVCDRGTGLAAQSTGD